MSTDPKLNPTVAVAPKIIDTLLEMMPIRQLAWTNPSLCNSVVNYLLTIVGLPLAYCLGVLDQNKKTHGHFCMFFASGKKQQAISTCNQVFDTVKASCRV
ncbi:MAG: hypothetical protein EBY22_16475 [Gammaproteobacteria bacterium]|nr:hypothetical protein [Gammaproteobacteria bacterium]